jgi:hypothetical protein
VLSNVISGLIAVVVGAPVASVAATIQVPTDSPSIQAAIANADPGDSIVVAPGFYVENIDFQGKSITVMSSHGARFTHVRPSDPSQPTVIIHGATASGAVIEGFDVRGGDSNREIIQCWNQSHASVLRNVIQSNNGGDNCIGTLNDSVVIEGNIIAYNSQRRAISVGGGYAAVLDNTIYSNGDGVGFFASATGLVLNNIIVSNSEHGLAGQPGIAEYNLIWQNQDDYECDGCYPNNISASPMLLGATSGEFMLRDGSPCIDAGHPAPSYNDPDGSRNDIGALPRVPAGMLPWNVRIGHTVDGNYHVTDLTPFVIWTRYPSSVSQDGLELEFGTDMDWSVAELWSSGVRSVSFTGVDYEGPDLSPGTHYYLRLRLRSGGVWGEWREFDFRTNTLPTAPATVSPFDGDTMSAHPLVLTVLNAADADGDALKYQFVVYQDLELTVIASSRENISEQPDSTNSGTFAPLQTGSQYWWRARAHDGHQWGTWSDSATFRTRIPIRLAVPTSYPTIQSAIDSARHLDTVAVAPGDYQENVSFRGVSVCVIATGGPSVTRIRPNHPSGSTVTFGLGEGPRALWSGFTMLGGIAAQYIVVTNESSPEISGNVFRDYVAYGPDPVVIGCWHGSPLIRNNLFTNNGGVACVGNSYLGSARIENNTFVKNHRGFYTITGDGVAINNIVVQSTEYGIYGFFDEQDHNLSWGNSPDYDGGATPHPTNLSTDPWFCDPTNEDFSLSAISPCATSGSDGNYMGAFPVGCSFPVTCHCDCHGDPNCDSMLNIIDVVLTIDRAFGASSESNDSSCVLHGILVDGRTDVDCNGGTDLADVVKMIDVALRGAARESRFCAPCVE